MKHLLACSSLLGLVVVALSSVVACGDDDDGGTPGVADAGPDTSTATDTGTGTDTGSSGGDATSDATANPLGFRPSNLDNSPGLADALAATDLGDVLLSDCGPEIDASEVGKMGCDPAGVAYKQIDGFGGTLKYTIFVAKNITVDTGKNLAVGTGGRPVILVAKESITINGGIDVSPGFAGAYALGQTTVGAGAGKQSSGDTSGCGGGGGFCGLGGIGGATTALGGLGYGVASIVPLQGGSGGGGLAGANGGGAIQLVAGTKITVAATGYIDAPGDGATRGGGSGGAILLEAPTVEVLGSITANGGSGGTIGGHDGARGARAAIPTPGAVDPSAVNGGAGGAGAAKNGTNGALNPTPGDGTGSGSGGGGVGWIRINTTSGAASITTGLVSPSMGACASQGTLGH